MPVVGSCLGEILAQRGKSVPATGEDFTEKVLHESEVGCGDGEHRDDVAQTNREGEVGDFAELEELGGESGVRSKQQARLPVDDASVEVRHGHGGCTDRRTAVDLGAVLGNDRRIVAPIELPRNREARVTADFGDTRTLKQSKRISAGTDKHELGQHLTRRLADLVPD